MNADHIQGWSRSLIFLGLIFLGTVVASIVGMGFSMVLFDDLVMVPFRGNLPTDDASWWQLHFQNLFSQALGFGAGRLARHPALGPRRHCRVFPDGPAGRHVRALARHPRHGCQRSIAHGEL